MIDACVHPMFPRADDINAYMPREYSKLRLGAPLSGVYPLPIDLHVAGSVPDAEYRPPREGGLSSTALFHAHAAKTVTGCLPGSDPGLMDEHVLGDGRADIAILLPLTRGLTGDPRLETAIDAATNEWLAETWLGEFNKHARYRGSIRVCPRHPADAVKEIEKWGDHPYFVQVAVPLEATALYGEQLYYPVWKAAAEHGLPVALHADNSGGVLPLPTALGYPLNALEAYAQQPMQSITHLVSMLAQGVFDRLKSLKVVFADGGFDYMRTIMWRVDADWRAMRSEVPWMTRAPSDYLNDHVRYIVSGTDGIDDAAEFARFIELNELEPILLYGSNYPHWDHLDAAAFDGQLPVGARAAITDRNARELYGLTPPSA